MNIQLDKKLLKQVILGKIAPPTMLIEGGEIGGIRYYMGWKTSI